MSRGQIRIFNSRRPEIALQNFLNGRRRSQLKISKRRREAETREREDRRSQNVTPKTCEIIGFPEGTVALQNSQFNFVMCPNVALDFLGVTI